MKLLFSLLLFLTCVNNPVISQYIAAKCNNSYYLKYFPELNQHIYKITNRRKHDKWEKNQRKAPKDSVLMYSFMFMPSSAESYKRISLLSDYTNIYWPYMTNIGIQQYYDENSAFFSTQSMFSLKDTLRAGIINDHPGYVNNNIIEIIRGLPEKELIYTIWRTRIVHAQNEAELSDIVRSSTREMLNNGYTDPGTDLLPFITMLMQEQHIYHYDDNRVIAFHPSSNEIFTVIDMLSALGSLDRSQKVGVCRDTHESGMRVARSIYDEYLRYTYPGKNYNVDDFVFLQAWVTPLSHHVTLLLINPENPRDLYELDWGRVYKKEDQEGVVIGNSIGTTIRLWQFNEAQNKTQSFDLIKTQWGLLFDKEILPEKEYTAINGIYNPLYACYGTYSRTYGERIYLGFSQGIMNAGQPFFLSSFSYTTRDLKVKPLFAFRSIIGVQTMILEDTQRRNYTLPWTEWYNTINNFNVLRYLAIINSHKLKLNRNISLGFFLSSQLDVFLSMVNYDVTEGGDVEGFNNNGDGNVWLSYGSELFLQNKKGTLFSGIRLTQRNFLMPSDVRYLAPHYDPLIDHVSVVNHATNIEGFVTVRKNMFETKTIFAFEQNKLNAQFVKPELHQSIVLGKNSGIIGKVIYFKQIRGIEYFWYPKEVVLFEAGIKNILHKWYFGLNYRLIKNDKPVMGFNLQKNF